jgi:3-hydroxy-9,10-secoandrosta-1,3,5(10)-triene-9,17-dione monooxygenase
MATSTMGTASAAAASAQEFVARARGLASKFAERAAGAEEARRLPAESAQEMLDAGLARILIPRRFGGCELDLATWLDVMLEISKADASHGWWAGLLAHHAHIIAQYPLEAQQAVWGASPDVAIAASFAPTAEITRVDGGYRVSGQNSAFASGVDHSTWVMVGGIVTEGETRDWRLFLIPRSNYAIRDTWHMAGMRATGSNTIVTDNVFVPQARTLGIAELRQGKAPGGTVHAGPLFSALFFHYAPLAFAAPMLGAARGAYEHFRERTKLRKAGDGSSMAEKPAIQVRMARATADLDAAELLLRRTTQAPYASDAHSQELLARSVRDFARASELVVAAIDAIVASGGTAGFSAANPIQRAWRDIHLSAMHISLDVEMNYAHFARMELGLGRDSFRPFF